MAVEWLAIGLEAAILVYVLDLLCEIIAFRLDLRSHGREETRDSEEAHLPPRQDRDPPPRGPYSIARKSPVEGVVVCVQLYLLTSRAI